MPFDESKTRRLIYVQLKKVKAAANSLGEGSNLIIKRQRGGSKDIFQITTETGMTKMKAELRANLWAAKLKANPHIDAVENLKWAWGGGNEGYHPYVRIYVKR